MFRTRARTGRMGSAAAALGVLLLHALVIAPFLTLHLSRTAEIVQREIEIGLLPLRKAAPPPAPVMPADKRNKHAIAPIENTIRALSNVPLAPSGLPAPGNALNCGMQCGYSGLHYDPNDVRSFTLNEPPPEHKWSQPEIDRYVMRTADPCLAEKSAHVPCVHEIIYGATTIPDPSKPQTSGLSVLGLPLFGSH